MPSNCVVCPDDVEICGPDVTQADCDPFKRAFKELANTGVWKCPDGWCFSYKCMQPDGSGWSIFRPTRPPCRKFAYMKYNKQHEDCACPCPPPTVEGESGLKVSSPDLERATADVGERARQALEAVVQQVGGESKKLFPAGITEIYVKVEAGITQYTKVTAELKIEGPAPK